MLFSPKPKERLDDLYNLEDKVEGLRKFLDVGGPMAMVIGPRRCG